MAYLLYIRRYAPFASFGGGFEGDVRDKPSTAPSATARTIGIIKFERNGVQGYEGFSSGSEFLGAGAWLAQKIGKHYSSVKAIVTNVQTTASTLSFTAETAGANPLVPVVAPDITTFVDLKITFGADMRYEGTVRGCGFPNAEIFVIEPSARQVLLFDFRTGKGRQTGPAYLIGDHSKDVLGTFAVTSVQIGPPAPTQVTQGK